MTSVIAHSRPGSSRGDRRSDQAVNIGSASPCRGVLLSRIKPALRSHRRDLPVALTCPYSSCDIFLSGECLSLSRQPCTCRPCPRVGDDDRRGRLFVSYACFSRARAGNLTHRFPDSISQSLTQLASCFHTYRTQRTMPGHEVSQHRGVDSTVLFR